MMYNIDHSLASAYRTIEAEQACVLRKGLHSRQCGMFSTFIGRRFPQLIAGPIVQYGDIAEQLKSRGSLGLFFLRAKKILLRHGQKVIIANTMTEVADQIWALETAQMGVSVAWLSRLLDKNPIKPLNWVYTTFAVMVGWVFFHLDSIAVAGEYIRKLFCFGASEYSILSFPSMKVLLALAAAVLCCGFLQRALQ